MSTVPIPLGARTSSLFEIPEKREIHTFGKSTTDFAWEPHDEYPFTKKTKKIAYENTYKMEPPLKFRPDKVKPIIERVLAENLEGRTYNPIECSNLSRELADDIKMQVRGLHFERYKILTLVTIGQMNEQGLNVGSRFLWDADRDNFAASSWANKHIYAVGTVYAVYYE